MHEEGKGAGDENQRPDDHGEAPEKSLLVPRCDSEVDDHNANSIERMQNHHAQQTDFEQPEKWILEGIHGMVERDRPTTDFVDRMHMHQKIKEQQQPRDALHEVRRHADQRRQICLDENACWDHDSSSPFLSSRRRLKKPMLSVRSMPLGQTAAQFIWVWQRQTPSCELSRISSRSACAVSRGSSTRSSALLMAAGP